MIRQTALDDLTTLLGQRATRSKSELDQHGRSETHFPLMPPEMVVYPETTAEVSALPPLQLDSHHFQFGHAVVSG